MFCNLLVSECMKVQLQRIKVVCNQRVSFCRRVLLKRRRSDHHLYTSCCSWRVATCCVLMLQLDTVVCPSQCTPQCPKEAWCTCPASDSSASHCSMRHAITSHYSCELFGFYRTSTSTPATATRSLDVSAASNVGPLSIRSFDNRSTPTKFRVKTASFRLSAEIRHRRCRLISQVLDHSTRTVQHIQQFIAGQKYRPTG